MSELEGRFVEHEEGAWRILKESKRIAVLGIKPESHAHLPAHYVPAFLQRVGWTIVPVPVYYPEVTEILGERVYRRLVDIPEPVDLVVVFRRPRDIPPHIPDLIASSPRAVWFQLGIRNDEAARALAAAGMDVVQDRCTMVEVRRMAR